MHARIQVTLLKAVSETAFTRVGHSYWVYRLDQHVFSIAGLPITTMRPLDDGTVALDTVTGPFVISADDYDRIQKLACWEAVPEQQIEQPSLSQPVPQATKPTAELVQGGAAQKAQEAAQHVQAQAQAAQRALETAQKAKAAAQRAQEAAQKARDVMQPEAEQDGTSGQMLPL